MNELRDSCAPLPAALAGLCAGGAANRSLCSELVRMRQTRSPSLLEKLEVTADLVNNLVDQGLRFSSMGKLIFHSLLVHHR